MTETLVETENLTKVFGQKIGFKAIAVQAVDGVDLAIKKGETLGLVGESGCGKTTTGKCILRLVEPTGGKVYFKGNDITKLSQKQMRKLRPNMQIVFQNPMASLNPRMTVEKTVSEPLVIHGITKKSDLLDTVSKLLNRVGLNPKEHMKRLPHQFSGGQRQRICIARALALNPEFIVLDEPTSSLDVSVQARILNLLQDLQKELGLTYLLISHNLSVIRYVSHKVAVMYLGKIVEMATKQELFENPVHPYTKALFSAIPIPDPHIKKKRMLLEGDVPNPANIPSGCRFHTRCPKATVKCKTDEPQLIDIGNKHYVACHLWSSA